MERDREQLSLENMESELHGALEFWQQGGDPSKLNREFERVRSANYGLTIRIFKKCLEDTENIRISPEKLNILPMLHWEKGNLMEFQINPIKEQTNFGRKPYEARIVTTDEGGSYLTLYHIGRGNTGRFLPEDIESIEIAKERIGEKIKRLKDRILGCRSGGTLQRNPQGA